MKLKILSTLIALLSFGSSHAQCWEQINTKTTNWNHPDSKNKWDWTQELFNDLYISGRTNPTQRYSPFWAPQSSASSNITLWDFQKYRLSEKKDFHPQDGWELLVKNFGEPSGGSGSGDVSYPFFVLYNRFTGKVRAFLLVPSIPGDTKSSALLKASFFKGKRKTALFQHMKPIGQAVVNFDSLDVDMPNNYANTSDYWLYSEFTVAYDPCTCADLGSNLESKIKFVYFLIDESKIDATIKGTLTERVTAQSIPQTGNPAYALNGIEDAKKLIEAGQKGYKEWGKYKSSFNKYLQKHTDSMYRDKFWKSIDTIKTIRPDLFDMMLGEIFDNVDPSVVTREKFMNGNLQVNVEYILGEGVEDLLTRHFSDFEKIASAIPYVGTAIGVIDLFVKGGEKKTSVAPKGPTVFEANLVLDGNIVKKSSLGPDAFLTPGYTTDTSLNFIPEYNNILGVFNVLELPEFEYFEIKPKVTNLTKDLLAEWGYYHTGSLCKLNYSDFHNEDGAGNVVFKQYKPTSKLKYVLNPASNLEVLSVEAAIILEYKGKQKLFIETPRDFSSSVAAPFHNQITTPQDNDSMYHWGYPSNAGCFVEVGGICYDILGKEVSRREKQYEKGSASVKRIQDIEAHSNLFFDNATANYPYTDSSTIRFRTSYLPITCFDQHSFTLLGTNNFGRIFTKLYVRLKRKDDPDAEVVTLVFSYDMLNKVKGAKKSSETGQYKSEVVGKEYRLNPRRLKCRTLKFTSIDISDYSYSKDFEMVNVPTDNLWFTPRNKDYAGEQHITVAGDLNIPNGSVIPDNSLIRAIGKITFGSNVSIGTGTIIQSETKIDASNVNGFNPEIVFEIVDINAIKHNCTNYNYSANHLSNDSIESLCNSIGYKQKAVL